MKPSEWFQANITNDHPDEQSREMERKILALLEAVEDMHQANDGHYATAIERRFVSREEIAILRAALALREK